MYEKLIKDGEVAVLYSPGYGAGISSWVYEDDIAKALVFDRELIELVLDGKKEEASELCEKKYPSVYTGGFKDAKVEWIPIGTGFKIHEYDGFESIEYIGEINYYIA